MGNNLGKNIDFIYTTNSNPNPQSGSATCLGNPVTCNASFLNQSLTYQCYDTNIGNYFCIYAGTDNTVPDFTCTPGTLYSCVATILAPAVVSTSSIAAGVEVSWTPVVAATLYTVNRIVGGTSTPISTLAPPNTSLVDSGVQDCQSYTYTVIAQTPGGNITSAPSAPLVFGCALPVFGSITSTVNDNNIVVSWTATGIGVLFNVSRSFNGGQAVVVASNYSGNYNGSNYTYSDNALPNGTYTYTITATNPGGSATSSSTNATITGSNVKPPPPNPTPPGPTPSSTNDSIYIIIAVIVLILIGLILIGAFWYLRKSKKAKATKS